MGDKLATEDLEPLTIEDEYHDRAMDLILAKTWDELEVLEHAGYLLFRDVLQRRRTDGTFEKIPIRLRVARDNELRDARKEARVICEQDGLDPKLDPDLFDNVDTVCILARCIRNDTAPHEPMVPDPRDLEKLYDRASLKHLWARVEVYGELVNPRPEKISEADMFLMVAAIARERNIGPLAVFGSRAQNSYIISTAVLLQSLVDSKSSSESSDSSTAGN